MNFLKKHFDLNTTQLIINSKWIFISNLLGAALGFLRTIVIARGLGAEVFGYYIIVIAFVGIVQEILNLNLSTSIIKFGAEFRSQNRLDKLTVLIKQCLKVNVVMSILSLTVIAILIFFSYNSFIKKPGLEWFVISYAIAASFNYFNTISRSSLRLFFKFKLNSIIQIIMDFTETVVIIVAVLLYPQNLTIFFVAVVVTRLLNAVVCNLLAFWELKDELLPNFNSLSEIINEEKKKIKHFVIHNSLGNTLKSLLSQGDVLLLGFLAGPIQVGYYSIAKKLAYSILVLTDPLVDSIYPQLSKLYAEERFEEVKKMISRITTVAILPAIIFLFLTYYFNEWVIVTIYGKSFEPASLPFYFFLIGSVLGSMFFWATPLIQSMGLAKLRLKVYIASIIISFGVALQIVPNMQAAGMAIALLVSNLIIWVSFIIKANLEINTVIGAKLSS